ncbi:hypothetical protein GTY57_29405 [Streptomyces sp. SID5475]|nr:hypothetical protein [Streptomyces sp. SID5475]
MPSLLPRLGSAELFINWGLGLDSSSYLAKMLENPAAHGVDLQRTVVLHMATGDEWPDTVADAEQFILPLLREHGVRLVQLARAGQAKAAGIEILDDSSSPHHLVPRGSWTLWDELETCGTVPQQAGTRLCSLHAKAEVGDRFTAAASGGRPFRQVIGFNADETGRAEADRRLNKNPLRTGVFPLIEWGWGRQACEDYLYDRFGVRWKKSYCSFCCFPVSLGALPAHLQRMRAFPDIAGRVLRLEYTAMRLNTNGRLFGRRSLLEMFEPADQEVLTAFARELDCLWASYRVRRILPASRSNPQARAPALRAVERSRTGTRRELGRELRRRAARLGLPVEEDPAGGSVRVWLRRRGNGFPAVEEFWVTAPAHVHSKQQDRFEAEWAAHTDGQQLVFPLTA